MKKLLLVLLMSTTMFACKKEDKDDGPDERIRICSIITGDGACLWRTRINGVIQEDWSNQQGPKVETLEKGDVYALDLKKMVPDSVLAYGYAWVFTHKGPPPELPPTAWVGTGELQAPVQDQVYTYQYVSP